MAQFIMVFLVTLSVSLVASASITKVECRGFVSFENSSMQGNTTITLELQENGTWLMNSFLNAGENLSSDPNVLILNTYRSFRGAFQSKAAYARYDIGTQTLDFEYKYDSGLLGGGTQKSKGTFTDCQILE